MRLLALDPGSHLGWCFGKVGGQPHSNTYRLPKPDDGQGLRFAAMERFIMAQIVEAEIDRVYFEEPFLDHRGGPGAWHNAPPRSFKSEALRWGYPAIIAMAAAKQGVKCVPVAVGTWRSLLGAPTQAPRTIKATEARRAWIKAETKRRVEQLGFPSKSQDEADAIGIWYAMQLKIEGLMKQPDLFKGVKL